MKTLTKNNISLYIFDDNEKIIRTPENIMVGDPIKFIISDCNLNNSYIHENVVLPQDWERMKYSFDGNEWIINESWTV